MWRFHRLMVRYLSRCEWQEDVWLLSDARAWMTEERWRDVVITDQQETLVSVPLHTPCISDCSSSSQLSPCLLLLYSIQQTPNCNMHSLLLITKIPCTNMVNGYKISIGVNFFDIYKSEVLRTFIDTTMLFFSLKIDCQSVGSVVLLTVFLTK